MQYSDAPTNTQQCLLTPNQARREVLLPAISVRPSSLQLPRYSNRICCGFPSPAQDHAEAPISLDELLDIHAPHVYIVRASGDSMIGAGIYDNDWLVVDRSLTAQHRHIIIAALHGEPLVRRLYLHDHTSEQPQLQLHAENPNYAPITVQPNDDFYIWGVVRHSIRRQSP